MPPAQALSIAEEKGLDLVEIAATATPPVCRIMNSGKYFYQQAKRESEARKHQRHIQVKEVKFRPKISSLLRLPGRCRSPPAGSPSSPPVFSRRA